MGTREWDPAKPDLWEVAPLDTTRLDAAAKTYITRLLDATKSREARLRKAVDLADHYALLEAQTRAERDKTALAIEAHFNVRRGAALHVAIGVNRTRWLSMRNEGVGKRHPKSKADPRVLEQLAADTFTARQRAHYAREVRDDIVRELAETMTNVELGELIGRNPSQVSHIKYPGRPRPKPRPKEPAA